jgi:hypothetical protein
MTDPTSSAAPKEDLQTAGHLTPRQLAVVRLLCDGLI